jgi:hypothetical protein
MAPAIEGGLRILKTRKRREREHFRLEAAVEALVLAAPLRMIGSAVNGLDAELEQPDAQRRPLAGPATAPGRAVIDIDLFRQAVMAERRLQPCLHGLCLLVGASRKPHGEARMIIDDGQRMQPGAATQSHLPLEVHLPQRVRLTALECAISAAGTLRRDAAMA